MTNADAETQTDDGEKVTLEHAHEDNSFNAEPYADGEDYEFAIGDTVFVDYTKPVKENNELVHDHVEGVILDAEMVQKDVEYPSGTTETITGHIVKIGLENGQTATVETISTTDEISSPIYTGSDVFDFPHNVFGCHATIHTEASLGEMQMGRAEAKAEARLDRQREKHFSRRGW